MTTISSVDPDQLAQHVASMYRDVANETGHDLHFHTGRALAEARKPAVFAEAARVLRPGGRLALADIVTEHAIAARTAAQPDLWAACIAGAGQREDDLHDIMAAGLKLRTVRRNTACRFASGRAQRTSSKYGAPTIEPLIVKPTQETSK